MKIYCEDTKETCTTFTQYLKSEHWNNLKNKYNDKYYSKKCNMCNRKNVQVSVYHKTLNKLGNESLSDLTKLCADCKKELDKQKVNPKHSDKSLNKIWDVAYSFRRKCIKEEQKELTRIEYEKHYKRKKKPKKKKKINKVKQQEKKKSTTPNIIIRKKQ